MKPTSYSLICATLTVTAMSSHADQTRNGTATNLNLAGAWTSGVLPGTGDIALWDSNSTLSNTLAGAQTWGGLNTSGASGAVTITTSANLVLDHSTDANTAFNVGSNNFSWSGNTAFHINGAAGVVSTNPGATFAGSSMVTITSSGTKNWSTNASTNGVTNLTFTGTLQLRGAAIPAIGILSTNWLALGGGGGQGSNNGTLVQTGSFSLDTGDATSCGSFVLTHAFAGQYLKLSSLSGTGSVRSDWGADNTAGTQLRGIELSQSGNTVLSGSILSHNSNVQNRGIDFVKKGTGTLTLTGGLGSSQTIGSRLSKLNFNVQEGTLQWGNGTTNITYVNAANWDGTSTFNIGANGTFRIAANGAFDFSRTLTGGTGIFEVASGTVTASKSSTSFAGTVKVTGGTLKLGVADAISGSSQIIVGASTTLDVSGVSWTLGSSQTLSGVGTVAGNATIAGDLAPGSSPGALTFNNDLDLTSTSEWLVEIGGTGTSDFDRLLVTGSLDAGGQIKVSLINGFNPANYSSFDIANFASFTDSGYGFDFTGAPLDPGLSWDTSAFSTTGTIAVIPEQSVALLGGIGALLLLRRRKGR
ncbi:MAG: hypothetical protein J0M04_10110 [Verrucomicrobia bacterium]|nr:hypothetical protein [Verrucomicrobiota bacterium]